MKLFLISFTIFLLSLSQAYGKCYLQVGNVGGYDLNLIHETTMTHLSNFVEKIDPMPMGGIQQEGACLYHLNITENDSGLLLTLRGKQINSSGTSNLRGLNGYRQALFQAILKADPNQKRELCSAYSNLLKEECSFSVRAESTRDEQTSFRYSILKQRLPSDPTARKKYKMAHIFQKRGKTEKAQALHQDILNQYPNSLEAVLVQLSLMKQDVVKLRKQKLFHQDILLALLNIPKRYHKLDLYQELTNEMDTWVIGLLEQAEKKKKFNDSLLNIVRSILEQDQFAQLHNKLKNKSLIWLKTLGNQKLNMEKDSQGGAHYYEMAKQFGLSPQDLRIFEDQVRGFEIQQYIKQGDRDLAEMALVEWEVEDPDSLTRQKLQKEFDLPQGMVTIPGDTVNGTPVEAFNLDIYETTNQEFLTFVKANPSFQKSKMTMKRNDKGYLRRWNGDFKFDEEYKKLPIVFVSQIVAMEYCKWKGKRLPTSLEWGLAAGEGKRNYPWGNQAPTKEIAQFSLGFGDPSPVDSHPLGRNPQGVHHLAGNVWDLTSTVNNGEAVSRGGSYYDGESTLRSNNHKKTQDSRNYSSRFTGFRCAQ